MSILFWVPCPPELEEQELLLKSSVGGAFLAKHLEIAMVIPPSLTKTEMTNGKEMNLQQGLRWVGGREDGGVSGFQKSHASDLAEPLHDVHVLTGLPWHAEK